MMKIYMNTFCFMQDSEANEAESYLGRKTFHQKMEIENTSTPSHQNRSIHWELGRKHIDLANKNENIHPDFFVSLE